MGVRTLMFENVSSVRPFVRQNTSFIGQFVRTDMEICWAKVFPALFKLEN